LYHSATFAKSVATQVDYRNVSAVEEHLSELQQRPLDQIRSNNSKFDCATAADTSDFTDNLYVYNESLALVAGLVLSVVICLTAEL